MKRTITKENRIDALFDKYIFECKLHGYSADTLRNKEIYFSLFYDFAEANSIKTTEQITQEFLNSFVFFRMKKDIKEVSVNSCSTSLNTFFRWLYEQGYLSHKLKFSKLKTQESAKAVYSTEELNILLQKPETASFSEYRTWVIINYILGTGNRISSVLSITNADVNLIDGFITLPHTKNKRLQTVPLSSSLIFILKQYMDIRQGESTDKLFCTEHGEPLSRGGADKAIRRYCDNRGVECLGHHALRHTFAKIAVRDCNIDSFRLQRLLGHSDIRTTEHYVQMFSDDLKQNLDTFTPLERLLQQNQPKEHIRIK
ncbi:MAG: tyrosine-type recombinase/integrase [Clostridia bacterium]|nr:tyrosine-type recombinase/integrase [Clostridia bacterium]